MNLKEMYQQIGGDYDKAVARFLNDDMLKVFCGKYFESTSFASLEKAMEARNIPTAFEAAHSLKGLTLSMEFTKLADSCVRLTEDLRAGVCDSQTMEYWDSVKQEYLRIAEIWRSV